MKLKEQIAVRVDGNLKGLVLQEVKTRRARGLGADGADVVRDALIEYFERKAQAVKEAVASQAGTLSLKLALALFGVSVLGGLLFGFFGK